MLLLIFTEIIEINVCDLEKNTRKNIDLREKFETENFKHLLDNDEKLGKVDINEYLEIELETDNESSSTINN